MDLPENERWQRIAALGAEAGLDADDFRQLLGAVFDLGG
jgi:hypothetical protein